MRSTVYLAAEDLLGLAVGRRLIEEQPKLSVFQELNARGFGNLRSKSPKYDEMAARGLPVLLITDLDADPCPRGKILAWLDCMPHPAFLFRVCVREVESWLLADAEALAELLKVSPARIPREPESLQDPKRFLIKLSESSPARLRSGLKPLGRATIGPDYNVILSDFIRSTWSPDRAARNAPSLARARLRILELAQGVAE